MKAPLAHVPYLLVCTVLGLLVGWLPMLVHGPIPEKFDVLYIDGQLAVWAFYVSRALTGFWVGVASWPARWYLRGPLIGFVAFVPLAIMLLATPGCGTLCARLNTTSAVAIGTVVAGLAYLLTGRHHR